MVDSSAGAHDPRDDGEDDVGPFVDAFGFGDPSAAASEVEVVGVGALPSAFAVTGFATAAVAVVATAVRELVEALTGAPAPPATVDRRLTSLWLHRSIDPIGWTMPAAWDDLAGDYPTADGWIRLHTNAPAHRLAALRVLQCADDRAAVAATVADWRSEDLETAMHDGGGCAAVMRSAAEWAAHPQGRAVRDEPIVDRTVGAPAPPPPPAPSAPPTGHRARSARPLEGVRVLDLTRVLAGPGATRLLAALGADVLRIDPPGWEEPAVAPDMTVGKRCGRLDLRQADDVDRFRGLLAAADIIVHGYRPGALDGLGFGGAERAATAAGLVDISLDAYGWTGPWRGRRGFDSLVQMSSGIAHAGMVGAGTDHPSPLPAQALDHVTGYLMAADAVRGWTRRLTTGQSTRARLSLARTAITLLDGPPGDLGATIEPAGDADLRPAIEATAWGPARRFELPFAIPGVELGWDRPATTLGSQPPPLAWLADR